MRVVLWIAFVVGPGKGTFTGPEACHFLGSRFAHRFSTCRQGICSGIGRDQSGMFAPYVADLPVITCEAAVEEMQVFLSETLLESSVSRIEGNQVDPAGEILEFLRQTLLPGMRIVTLGIDPSAGNFIDFAEGYDSWTLRLAASDWAAWSSTIAPRIVASDQWVGMHNIYATLMRMLLTDSMLASGQRKSLFAVLSFYFDFVALMGRHLVPDESVRSMGYAVVHTQPAHRQLGHRDARFGYSLGVPSTASDIVVLSKYIDQLADRAVTDTHQLRWFFKGWEANSNSAAHAIIGDQIRGSICPILDRFVSFFANQVNRIDHVSLGVTLIDLCRGSVPLARLQSSRRALATLVFGHNHGVIRWGRNVEFLYNDSMSWGNGLHGEAEDLRVLAATLLEDFLLVQITNSAQSGEGANLVKGVEMATALGRAVGLAIRHGADVKFLPVAPSVARLLHPRIRARVGSMNEMRAHLHGMSLESFVALAGGVEEALGPGGIYMFSNDAWIALFRRVEEDFILVG